MRENSMFRLLIDDGDGLRLRRLGFEMPDVYHAFRRGHRVTVQVQSSWFPLVDRNPQKFMEIPKATAADFERATQRVYRSRVLNSSVTVSVEQGSPRPLRPAG